MAKPPEDVPPDELWLKLNEPRPSEVFDFPRRGSDGKPVGQVRIQVLKQESHGMAKVMAQTALHKEAARFGLKDLKTEDMQSPVIQSALSDLVAAELLAMSLHSVKPMPGADDTERPSYSRLFHSAADIRAKLTADEMAVLFNAYLLTQEKYGPFERGLQDGDVNAWIKRLEEGGSEFPLALLPWLQLVELTSSLAARMSTLSRILVSQWLSLPDILQSDLKGFCLDMSSSGEQPDDSIHNLWENSAEATDLAARMANDQKDRESAQ